MPYADVYLRGTVQGIDRYGKMSLKLDEGSSAKIAGITYPGSRPYGGVGRALVANVLLSETLTAADVDHWAGKYASVHCRIRHYSFVNKAGATKSGWLLDGASITAPFARPTY